jgi:hypothetical protein
MTAQADPYVRVYYRIIDDERFTTVFDDDHRLACWLRLLLIADGTYPAPAPIPAGVKRAALGHLVDVGLVELAPGGRFRIHGMEAERGSRAAKAAASAQARWGRSPKDANAMRTHSDRNAGAEMVASDDRMLSNARGRVGSDRSGADRSGAEVAGARDDSTWQMAQLVEELTGRPNGFGNGSRVLETLRSDVTQLGVDRVGPALRDFRATHHEPMDAAVLVYGAHRALMPVTTTTQRNGAAAKGYKPTQEDRDALGD